MSDSHFVALVAVASVFCIVRGIVDLRARRFVWGGLGVMIGLIILCVPVRTHAIKVDLPISDR